MRPPSIAGRVNYVRTAVIYLAALCALPFLMPSVPLATEIVIMTLATLSCHLLLVYGPLLSFGQGAFFGVGAYAAGLYAIHTDGSPLADSGVALVLGGASAAVAACLVGIVALRRIGGISGHGAGGITFLMLTFAVAQVGYFAAYSFPGVTGGENGLLGISRPPAGFRGLFDISLTSPWAFYSFSALVLAAVVVFVDIASNSMIGQGFKAIRENEDRASAVGYDIFALRLALFTLCGAIAGIAGALYGLFLGLVPLSAIDLAQSESIVIMAVLGGTGSLVGALVGTICYVLGADLLSRLWPHWPFALGAAIVLIVFFARGGLWGLVETVRDSAASRLAWLRSRPTT